MTKTEKTHTPQRLQLASWAQIYEKSCKNDKEKKVFIFILAKSFSPKKSCLRPMIKLTLILHQDALLLNIFFKFCCMGNNLMTSAA